MPKKMENQESSAETKEGKQEGKQEGKREPPKKIKSNIKKDLEDKLSNTKAAKSTKTKIDGFVDPVKQVISKGKNAADKINSKLEYNSVEYAMYYSANMFYGAIIYPLQSICDFLTEMKVTTESTKLRWISGGLSAVIISVSMFVGLKYKYWQAVSYAIGAMLGWWLVYTGTYKKVNSCLDDLVLMCLADEEPNENKQEDCKEPYEDQQGGINDWQESDRDWQEDSKEPRNASNTSIDDSDEPNEPDDDSDEQDDDTITEEDLESMDLEDIPDVL